MIWFLHTAIPLWVCYCTRTMTVGAGISCSGLLACFNGSNVGTGTGTGTGTGSAQHSTHSTRRRGRGKEALSLWGVCPASVHGPGCERPLHRTALHRTRRDDLRRDKTRQDKTRHTLARGGPLAIKCLSFTVDSLSAANPRANCLPNHEPHLLYCRVQSTSLAD